MLGALVFSTILIWSAVVDAKVAPIPMPPLNREKIRAQQLAAEAEAARIAKMTEIYTKAYGGRFDARTVAWQRVKEMIDYWSSVKENVGKTHEGLLAATDELERLSKVVPLRIADETAALARFESAKAGIESSRQAYQAHLTTLSAHSTLAARARAIDFQISIKKSELQLALAESEASGTRYAVVRAENDVAAASVAVAEARLRAAEADAEMSRFKIHYFPTSSVPDAASQARVTEANAALEAARATLAKREGNLTGPQAVIDAADEAAEARRGELKFLEETKATQAQLIAAISETFEPIEAARALAVKADEAVVLATTVELDLRPENVPELSPDRYAKARLDLADTIAQASAARARHFQALLVHARARRDAELAVNGLIPTLPEPESTSLALADVESSNRSLFTEKSALTQKVRTLYATQAHYEELNKRFERQRLAFATARHFRDTASTLEGQWLDAERILREILAKANAARAAAESRPSITIFSDSRIETYFETRARSTALALDTRRVDAVAGLDIEVQKKIVADARIEYAAANVNAAELERKAAERFLALQDYLGDDAGIELAQEKLDLAKASYEKAEEDLKLAKTLLGEAKATLARAEELFGQIDAELKKVDERVEENLERLQTQTAAVEAEAQARAASERAERDAETAALKDIYDAIPGYATSRTEGEKTRVIWMRDEAKKDGWSSNPETIVAQDRLVAEVLYKYANQQCTANDTDELKCLICNTYFEAGHEPFDGKLLTGRTAFNRMKADVRPTICKVIWKPHQYSWTADAKPKDNPTLTLPGPGIGKEAAGWGTWEVLHNSVEAALYLMYESTPYILNHYWNPTISNPAWARKHTCPSTTIDIGSHKACYLPIGSSRYSQKEVDRMKAEIPALFGIGIPHKGEPTYPNLIDPEKILNQLSEFELEPVYVDVPLPRRRPETPN